MVFFLLLLSFAAFAGLIGVRFFRGVDVAAFRWGRLGPRARVGTAKIAEHSGQRILRPAFSSLTLSRRPHWHWNSIATGNTLFRIRCRPDICLNYFDRIAQSEELQGLKTSAFLR